MTVEPRDTVGCRRAVHRADCSSGGEARPGGAPCPGDAAACRSGSRPVPRPCRADPAGEDRRWSTGEPGLGVVDMSGRGGVAAAGGSRVYPRRTDHRPRRTDQGNQGAETWETIINYRSSATSCYCE